MRITMTVLAALVALGGCEETEAEPATSPTAETQGAEETNEAPAEAPEPEPVRAADLIAPAPIAEAERLAPCAVELVHTTYDEETREPSEERHAIARMVRRWADELREHDWADVAPIPLSREQAAQLLPDPTSHDPGDGEEIFAEVADGALSYRFDERGRARVVDWDPVADSGDYRYTYRYECEPEVAADARPRWDEGG